MNKKIYIFIVLIIVGLIGLSSSYYLTQKKAWEKEIEASKTQEIHWQEKYNELLPQLEEYKIEIATLSQQITGLQNQEGAYIKKVEEAKERNELLSKAIVILQKEKEDLTQKTEALTQRVEQIGSPEYLTDIIKDQIILRLELKDLKEKIKTKDTTIESLVKYRENLETFLGQEKQLSQGLSRSILEEKKKSYSLNQEAAQKSSLFKKLETDIDDLEKSKLLLREKIQGLEEIVREKDTEIKALENKLNEAYGKNNALENKLEQSKEEKELLEEELLAAKRLYEEVKANNEMLSKRLLETNQKVTTIEEKLDKMELSLSDKEMAKKELEEKYRLSQEEEDLERKEKDSTFMLELTKTITPVEDKKEILPETEKKILASSSKHNFIIINLGEKDGVKIGDRFSLFRNGRKIGDIEITRIRAGSSFAQIISLQEGITVTTADTIQ